MTVLVVDPRLLVAAIVLPHSDAAKLLALLAYGRASVFSRSDPGPDERAEAARADAAQRAEMIEKLLPDGAPDDLLLATSRPLTRGLVEYAQRLRAHVRYIRPDAVVRQVNAHAWVLAEVPPHTEARTYLFETAAAAGAEALVTDDEALFASKLAEQFKPVTIAGFVEQHLSPSFQFVAIDPVAVMRAAVTRLHPEWETLPAR